jgi:RNA polymerase sigma-70 factor (ECF subfamily)
VNSAADALAYEAVRDAYQAHYRRLVAAVFGLVGDFAEAQDLVQEAYARALARPQTFLEVEDPQAWLRTVAMNLARSRWRRRRLFDTMVRTGRVSPTAESVPGIDPDRVALVTALQQVPRSTREVIVLHHLADLPVTEVADTLGIPVGTVKARLSRGRALLATLLSESAGTAAPAAARGRSTRRAAASRLTGADLAPSPLPPPAPHPAATPHPEATPRLGPTAPATPRPEAAPPATAPRPEAAPAMTEPPVPPHAEPIPTRAAHPVRRSPGRSADPIPAVARVAAAVAGGGCG